VGVFGVLGLPPHPKTPNPQSPIPNPHYIQLNFKIKINKIINNIINNYYIFINLF